LLAGNYSEEKEVDFKNDTGKVLISLNILAKENLSDIY